MSSKNLYILSWLFSVAKTLEIWGCLLLLSLTAQNTWLFAKCISNERLLLRYNCATLLLENMRFLWYDWLLGWLLDIISTGCKKMSTKWIQKLKPKFANLWQCLQSTCIFCESTPQIYFLSEQHQFWQATQLRQLKSCQDSADIIYFQFVWIISLTYQYWSE